MVYWGAGDPVNLSYAVEGQAPSNYRAELEEILAAMCTIRDTMSIYTDSEWSAPGIQKMLSQRQQGDVNNSQLQC